MLLVIVQIAAAAGGLWAARAVYRAHVADRSTRILLVAVAVVFAAFTVLELIPMQSALAAADAVFFLFPLALVGLGLALMLDGQHDRVRGAIELIRERW